MSYLALARKWRPRRFEDVRGQDHVVRALSHALAADRLHHALLLTGTRGVGKTTLGRLICKGLNCEVRMSAQPCGECSTCREIDDGRCLDLVEIDAASRTKVDDTRSLLDNVPYAAVHARYKVYLIDEVHMLSTASFNALLKTLEEPPPHVKFILATTDPQKIPATVLSRCLQLNLKRLPVGLIRTALGEIIQHEGLNAEPAAIASLARAADGSMRDGLSLLDQAIAFAQGRPLKGADVHSMLGGVGRQVPLDLLGTIAQGDAGALVAQLGSLESFAPDYESLLNEIATDLQRIALLQAYPGAFNDEDDAALPELAARIGAEDVQVYYEIAVHGRRALPWAPDPRVGFEMTLLRMLAFTPEGASDDGPPPTPARRRATAPVPTPTAPPPANAAPPSPGADARAAQTVAARVPPALTPQAPATRLPHTGADAPVDWSERLAALRVEGLTRQLARNCAQVSCDDGLLRLGLEARTAHLLTEERRGALERAVRAADPAIRGVVIEVGSGSGIETPSQRDRRLEQERHRAAEQALLEDPTVRQMQAAFGATLRSVQPLDPPQDTPRPRPGETP